MTTTTLAVVLVVFVATLIRSAFGFGEALVAVPLLAFVVPLEVAAPLAVLVSITIAALVVARDWRQVQARSAAWLVLASLAGIPAGLWLLEDARPRLVKAALGAIVLAFGAYSLVASTAGRRWGVRAPALERDHRGWLLACGLAAGVLGGAYGMNGPPLVVYGTLRRWSPEHFRATLQGYFLPASVAGMVGYWLAGLWTPTVTRYYLLSLPAMLPAIWIGRVINRRMRGEVFLACVYAGLVATGALLLVHAARGG